MCVFLVIGSSCVDKPVDNTQSKTVPSAHAPALVLPPQLSPDQIVSQEQVHFRLGDGIERSAWWVRTQGS